MNACTYENIITKQFFFFGKYNQSVVKVYKKNTNMLSTRTTKDKPLKRQVICLSNTFRKIKLNIDIQIFWIPKINFRRLQTNKRKSFSLSMSR